MQHRGSVTSGGLEGKVQRVSHILSQHDGAQFPGNDIAREVVEHGRQVHPVSPDDLEVGEVRLPHFVRPRVLGVELIGSLDDDIGWADNQIMGLQPGVTAHTSASPAGSPQATNYNSEKRGGFCSGFAANSRQLSAPAADRQIGLTAPLRTIVAADIRVAKLEFQRKPKDKSVNEPLPDTVDLGDNAAMFASVPVGRLGATALLGVWLMHQTTHARWKSTILNAVSWVSKSPRKTLGSTSNI